MLQRNTKAIATLLATLLDRPEFARVIVSCDTNNDTTVIEAEVDLLYGKEYLQTVPKDLSVFETSHLSYRVDVDDNGEVYRANLWLTYVVPFIEELAPLTE